MQFYCQLFEFSSAEMKIFSSSIDLNLDFIVILAGFLSHLFLHINCDFLKNAHISNLKEKLFICHIEESSRAFIYCLAFQFLFDW